MTILACMDREPNAASVAIIEGDRVLLIQRAKEPYAGLWTLPGGRREPGETAEQCATREVEEELGIRVSELVHATTNTLPNWQLAVFATTRFAGDIVPSDEIAGHRWVTAAEAAGMRTTPGLDPTLELIFRALRRVQEAQAQQ